MEEVRSVKLRFTPRARADIAHIHRYIAQHNRIAATSVVRQIRLTSGLLARHPGLVFPTARYPYLVYHRIGDDEVVVIHVRDGRPDAPKERELSPSG